MTIVVSDTSPIVALSHLGRLDWLSRFFREVLIPPAVLKELQKPAWQGFVHDALAASYTRVQAPADRNRVGQLAKALDAGEAEALALALEVHAGAVLMDESEGRKTARRLGLTTIGVLGLLLRAKREGLIAAVGPELDRLQRDLGFHVSSQLRADVLRDAGETD